MNLLEHYIKEVHSVYDVTNKFEEKNGYSPNEPLFEIDLTYDCYGNTKRETRFFLKSEFEKAKQCGYFMA